jgi:hypothetical protein
MGNRQLGAWPARGQADLGRRPVNWVGNPYRILITESATEKERIEAELVEQGGIDLGPCFAFPTKDARNDALESVRYRYGWTVAEPV